MHHLNSDGTARPTLRCERCAMYDAELLTAAVFVGMLIGGLVAGNAADRFGRRSCLLVALGVNCTFAVLSAAAPSVGWLIAARVCAGLGKTAESRRCSTVIGYFSSRYSRYHSRASP